MTDYEGRYDSLSVTNRHPERNEVKSKDLVCRYDRSLDPPKVGQAGSR